MTASPSHLPRVTPTHERAGRAHGHAGSESGVSPQELRKRAARERLILLTRLMDSAISVPGLRTRVGLDALLGVIPVVGDLASAAIGIFMVLQARELGASRWLQARMVANLVLDTAVGAVPVAGDLFDVYFKAHTRNLKLLQKALGEPYVDSDGRAIDGSVIEAEAVDVTHRRR